jgi:type IV pilus assembly protein PilM
VRAPETLVEKKVPFWKREISLGRKKKEPMAAPVAPIGELVPTKTPAKTPFLKREITFGRKKKIDVKAPRPEAPVPSAVAAPTGASDVAAAGAAAAIAAAAATAADSAAAAPAATAQGQIASPPPKPAKAEKTPLLKREISFRRKPKPASVGTGAVASAATAEAAQAAPSPAVQAQETASPGEKKVPFYRRDISFGRKPASAAKSVAQSTATPEKKAPFYKREIALRGKPAGAAGAKRARSSRASVARSGTLVGVKVGASGISVARVAQGAVPELLDLVREPLPRGVIVSGEVREVERLATELAAVFDKHGIPKKAVRLGVSNNRIGVRIIEITGVMDPQQLENAIRFRAQEVLPIALEDAVLDYQQLGESVNADGELVRRILLVVAYRDLIDRYVVAFKDAGVRLVGIDLEAFGLLRALTSGQGNQERSEAAHVVVSIGHERSTFAVSDGRICEFTRVLEWGGSTLDVAIARQLNLAPSEVEPIKHVLVLDGAERALPPNVTAEQVALAADVIRRQLQTFARELVSSLQYYQNQPGSLGIGDIVISGGTSLMPGLASELQRLIGVSVRVGNPFERVKAAKGVVDDEQKRALAIAIGLAIEE